MRNYKLKLRHGNAEFEAEGDQGFVEKHLRRFQPFLNLPNITSKPSPKPKKARQARRKAAPPAPYPSAAIATLTAFLKQSKPQNQPATATAIGAHHVKHFKTPTFTSQVVASAAKAIGYKFANLAVSLKAAAKQGKIRKVKKATWKIISPKIQSPEVKAKLSSKPKASQRDKIPF